jgi:hypothetical protein
MTRSLNKYPTFHRNWALRITEMPNKGRYVLVIPHGMHRRDASKRYGRPFTHIPNILWQCDLLMTIELPAAMPASVFMRTDISLRQQTDRI